MDIINSESIGNLGKAIKLFGKDYTVFNYDVEHRPFSLKDDKGNVYYLLLKDFRSTTFYVIDWKFNTKFTVTKEELELAINPPPAPNLTLHFNASYSGGGGLAISNNYPKIVTAP
ncbi:MAG TPA: hypothetical protein PLP33_27805 [Leptospiraceae bacterium]|nr:hypothetical protein [Leptospiraceae bacterium]